MLNEIRGALNGRRDIGLAAGGCKGQGLVGLVANVVLLTSATRPLVRKWARGASYLDEHPVEQLQSEQGDHDEHHTDGDADVDEDPHVPVKHGEERVLVLIHHVHEDGEVGQVIAAANTVRAVGGLQTTAIGRPGTTKNSG